MTQLSLFSKLIIQNITNNIIQLIIYVNYEIESLFKIVLITSKDLTIN